MVYIRKLKTFFHLPIKRKRLFAEAVATFVYVKLVLILLPFRKVADMFAGGGTPDGDADKEAQILKEIRWAVNMTSKYVPYGKICLVQALAAKRMAARRGILTTAYFGVSRNEEGKLIFHAWLKYGDLIVTGGKTENIFQQLDSIT